MVIDNGKIRAEISQHGAELTSLRFSESDEEYIWQADPQYWARHAPMLFPIVGKVWDGKYRAQGNTYNLSQHGFARDMDFTPLCQDTAAVCLALESTPETIQRYPYHFRLEASYTLEDNSILTTWTVKNPGQTDMYFQIGAHPGFTYPGFHAEDFIHGYFRIISAGTPLQDIIIGKLTPQGFRSGEASLLSLDADAMLPITPGLFRNDALVIEEQAVDQVVLYDAEGNPRIDLQCDCAPVWGLWSPPAKNAPFVCIEPWAGRCDIENYDQDISKRDYINRLEPGKSFSFSYKISIFQ